MYILCPSYITLSLPTTTNILQLQTQPFRLKWPTLCMIRCIRRSWKNKGLEQLKKLFPPSLFYLTFSVINVFIISISISMSISSNYLYPYKQHVSVYIHIYRAHFKYHIISYFLPSLNIWLEMLQKFIIG